MKDKLSNKKLFYYVGQMVKALENPILPVYMSSYIRLDGNTCSACAAAQTILRIQKVKKVDTSNLKPSYFNGREIFRTDRLSIYKLDKDMNTIVGALEPAINYLRKGELYGFLTEIAYVTTITREQKDLVYTFKDLPNLQDNYTKAQLNIYKEFYKFLRKHKI